MLIVAAQSIKSRFGLATEGSACLIPKRSKLLMQLLGQEWRATRPDEIAASRGMLYNRCWFVADYIWIYTYIRASTFSLRSAMAPFRLGVASEAQHKKGVAIPSKSDKHHCESGTFFSCRRSHVMTFHDHCESRGLWNVCSCTLPTPLGTLQI